MVTTKHIIIFLKTRFVCVQSHFRCQRVGQLLIGKVPVDELPPGRDVVGPRVLEVDVVGMLPHVARQEWLQPSPINLAEGAASIVRRDDLQVLILGVQHQPRPATAKVPAGFGREVPAELIERSERSVYGLGDFARRTATRVRSHALPVKKKNRGSRPGRRC